MRFHSPAGVHNKGLQHRGHGPLLRPLMPANGKIVYNPTQPALVNLDLPPHVAKIADNS